MALPFIPLLAGFAGGAVLNRLFNPTLDAAFSVKPSERASMYKQNREKPNVLLGVDSLLQLYHNGYFGRAWDDAALSRLNAATKPHGVECYVGEDETPATRLWQAHLRNQRSKPSPAEVRQFYWLDMIGTKEADQRLNELGYSEEKERKLLLDLPTPLGLSDVIDLVHRRKITPEEGVKRLRHLGVLEESDAKLLLERESVWGMPDLVALRNRRQITQAQFQRGLWQAGYWEDEDIRRAERLREFLPPPSDLIRFAVKDIFDPALPDREGMLRELGEQRELKDWLAAQGIGSITFGTPDGRTLTRDVGELYWLASFELPSPTQSYEMLHRLRPDRVGRYRMPGQTDADVAKMATSLTDVRALLKDKDYRPGWRDRLAAISFRPIGRIDLRRLYGSAVFGPPVGTRGFEELPGREYRPTQEAEKELYAACLDFGYAPTDAGRLAYWTAKDWEAGRGGRQKAKALKAACRAYGVGAVTAAEMRDELLTAGYSPAEAEAAVANCDLEHKLSVMEKIIRGVRARYLAGTLDPTQVTAELARWGVRPERAALLVELWNAEWFQRPKEVQAEQLCKWVGSGIISLDDMRKRLLRLGWSEDDARRIMRHCVLGHNARAAKERERAARAAAQQQERVRRELEKIARRQAADREKVAAELRRRAERALKRVAEGRAPALLKKYFKKQVITVLEIRTALLARGWSPVDVERWIVTELDTEGEDGSGT